MADQTATDDAAVQTSQADAETPRGGGAGGMLALLRTVVGPVTAWVLIVAGGGLVIAGWVSVSGAASVDEQVDDILALGLTGLLLLGVGGAALVAHRLSGFATRMTRVERDIEALHEVAVGEGRSPGVGERPAAGTRAVPAGHGESDTVVTVPNGVTYHRADCEIATGKEVAVAVDTAADGGLVPCRLCEPPVLEGS